MKRVVDQEFPLELKVPNAQTSEAMAEIDDKAKRREARFSSANEMFAELEKVIQQRENHGSAQCGLQQAVSQGLGASGAFRAP